MRACGSEKAGGGGSIPSLATTFFMTPDLGVAAQSVPPAVCSHPCALVTHPAGGHSYTHAQDTARCTPGLGDAQCYGTDVRGSETCRGDYPAASDGHRNPHRACVARTARFIGPCASLTRLILHDSAA